MSTDAPVMFRLVAACLRCGLKRQKKNLRGGLCRDCYSVDPWMAELEEGDRQ